MGTRLSTWLCAHATLLSDRRKKLLPVVRVKAAAEARTSKEAPAGPGGPNADQKSDNDEQDKSEAMRPSTDVKSAEQSAAEDVKQRCFEKASGLADLLGAYDSDEESS